MKVQNFLEDVLVLGAHSAWEHLAILSSWFTTSNFELN